MKFPELVWGKSPVAKSGFSSLQIPPGPTNDDLPEADDNQEGLFLSVGETKGKPKSWGCKVVVGVDCSTVAVGVEKGYLV